MDRSIRAGGLVLLVLTSAPAAFAQASLAGVVRDASGGVLPGVSVEAASPALIEKARTTVTDGSGQYRIVDLTRPGDADAEAGVGTDPARRGLGSGVGRGLPEEDHV